MARNHFRCAINESLIRAIGSSLVTSGLHRAGYTFVNLDDCWADSRRDANNITQANATKFPSGIPALSSFLHSLGLRFGLYSDAGPAMCYQSDAPGGYGFEDLDARTYAQWGVDYLKYDDCNAGDLPYFPRYSAMSGALLRTGRPILYSLCSARANRWQPMWSRAIGNSWRTTTDIGITWTSVLFNLDGNSVRRAHCHATASRPLARRRAHSAASPCALCSDGGSGRGLVGGTTRTCCAWARGI